MGGRGGGGAMDLRLRKTLRWLPAWPLAIWAVVTLSGLAARPLLATVEAPLLAAAWWQWLGMPGAGADPVPFMSALVRLGWSLFGVNETWARLLSPLMALLALLSIGPVARLLWPEQPRVAPLAGILLAGTGAFVLYSGFLGGQVALLLAALGATAGVGLVRRGRRLAGWAVFATTLALGLAVEGWLALVLVLPVPLSAPLWLRRGPAVSPAWYIGLACGVAAGVLLAWPWLPVGAAGGAPARSWYWLLALLPALLYPWLWWATIWRSARRRLRRLDEDAFRLCAVQAAAALAAALMGGGDADRILPALPALSLAAARVLVAHDSRPKDFHAVIPGLPALFIGLVFFLLNIVPVAHLDAVWRGFFGENESLPIWLGGSSLVSGLALLGGGFVLAQLTARELAARAVQVGLLSVLLAVTFNVEFLVSLRQFFDLAPLAGEIRAQQQAGRPVGYFGRYGGEFDFAGRLDRPLAVLDDAASAASWLLANPDGVVVAHVRGSLLHLPGRPLRLGPAGDDWVALWSAETVRASGGAVLGESF